MAILVAACRQQTFPLPRGLPSLPLTKQKQTWQAFDVAKLKAKLRFVAFRSQQSDYVRCDGL